MDVFRSFWGLEARLASNGAAAVLSSLRRKGFSGVEFSLADSRVACGRELTAEPLVDAMVANDLRFILGL